MTDGQLDRVIVVAVAGDGRWTMECCAGLMELLPQQATL